MKRKGKRRTVRRTICLQSFKILGQSFREFSVAQGVINRHTDPHYGHTIYRLTCENNMTLLLQMGHRFITCSRRQRVSLSLRSFMQDGENWYLYDSEADNIQDALH